MLRLIQSRGAPVRRIFRQLAELGVPCSMTEALVGCTLTDWADATEVQEAKLQALWMLAEAYTDVANREPGAIEGLEPVVLEAMRLGVWYEAPSCAAVIIEKRANKVRRFVEDIESPCRPGRSHSAERMWRGVMREVMPSQPKLSRKLERVVELRLQLMTASEIADAMILSSVTVKRYLQAQEVINAIEAVRPIAELEQAIALRVRDERSKAMKAKIAEGIVKAPTYKGGRPRKGWDDAWVLAQVAQGASVHSLAAKLGTSRQALSYRIQQARRAALKSPPR